MKTNTLHSPDLCISWTLFHFSTVKNGNSFIKSSLENCCNWFYSWDFTNCMILGGASSSAYATNEFYVNYYSNSCKQSCLEGTAGLNCGGIAPSWKEVFATASSCCEDTLWWVETNKCVADSDLNPPVLAPGSTPVVVIPEWYRDGEKVCSFSVPLYLARCDHLFLKFILCLIHCSA